ncbi:abpC, partial [Symbiodinium necroappetens]
QVCPFAPNQEDPDGAPMEGVFLLRADAVVRFRLGDTDFGEKIPEWGQVGEKSTYASMSFAKGPGLGVLKVNNPSFLWVFACDRDGARRTEGGDRVVATLSHPEDFQDVAVEDLQDGRYKVTFLPLTPGSFSLQISIGAEGADEDLTGCPFTLEVRPPTVYHTIGIDGEVEGKAQLGAKALPCETEICQELCDLFLALGLEEAVRPELSLMLSAFEDQAGHVDCSKLWRSLAEAGGCQCGPDGEKEEFPLTSVMTRDEAAELCLPSQVEGHAGWMADLLRDFSAGCSISRVEERAMQMRQLNLVISCLCEGCNRDWVDPAGRPLTPPQVNLYHVVDLLVRPATAARACSFVELVAEAPQPCDWFVSHWWGEPVVDFALCLKQHLHDRNLQKDAAYWVCAYANNQWAVHQEIGADPATSSFQRAMGRAAGTVSIVDRDAVCYTRVWCIYETYISTLKQVTGEKGLDGLTYYFDIYTYDPKQKDAIGIAEGFIAADGTGPKQARRKRHRESRFPFELITKAFDIRVEHAEATRESDRRMILNSIAQAADLSRAPALEHEGYAALNDVLHGRFAAASFVKAAAIGTNLSRHAAALSRSRLHQLTLHFGGDCQKNLKDEHVVLLACSLPVESLQDLFLGFQGCRQLSDVAAVALGSALGSLTRLRRLELRLSSGPQLSDEGVGALAAGLHGGSSTLESLNLDISAQSRITE